MPMTSDPAMPEESEPDRAQALFVAERLLEQPVPAGRDIGIRDLAAYLLGDPRLSSAQINRALLQYPGLRADLSALRARFTRVEAPVQAAASTDDMMTRTLSGGSLSLFSVPPAPLVYLNVQFDDPALSGQRLVLVVETGDGTLHRLALPEANDEGAVMAILDPSNTAEDADLIAALTAPTSTGSFIETDEGHA